MTRARRVLRCGGLALGACFQMGCYTLSQGLGQLKLLAKREAIAEVLKRPDLPPETRAKLEMVPEVLAFAERELGLKVGDSYRKYVQLEGKALSWLVKAAPKRELRLKSWWFPLVGKQPYLGFFERSQAEAFRDTLKAEGYDTAFGGVQAFSLLGYIADPLYSSMVEGNSAPDLAETLLHECTHLTLYIPGHPSFNENLADFVAKKATVRFFAQRKDAGFDSAAYEERYRRELAAQAKFKPFLLATKARLEAFYAAAARDPALATDEAFLSARGAEFERIAADYKAHMAGAEEGSSYAHAFRAGGFNNAVIMGYSLYEAKQEPFEKALAAAGGLRELLVNLRSCLLPAEPDEDRLWRRLENCPARPGP